MGIAGGDEGDQGATGKLIDELVRLNADLAVPTPAAYGISPERWSELIPIMAEQALASGSPSNNPVVPTAEQIAKIYRQVWVA
jgi:alcohol dehydrogenase class IV